MNKIKNPSVRNIKNSGRLLRSLHKEQQDAKKALAKITEEYSNAGDEIDIPAQNPKDQDLKLAFVVDKEIDFGWLELACLDSGQLIEIGVEQIEMLYRNLGHILGKK